MTKKHEKSNFFAEKKTFSDLQNLHPGVFRGAGTVFEGPGAPGGPGGARPGGTQGRRPALPGGSAEWRKPFKSAGPCTLAGRLGRASDHLLKTF